MVGAHLADAFVAQRISVAVQLSMAQEAAEAAERTTPPRGEREREGSAGVRACAGGDLGEGCM